MNPLQTELLAHLIDDDRRRSRAHPSPAPTPAPLPPRRGPLAWARAVVAAVASPVIRLGAGARANAS